jgi:tetratricopeptide (TPR) repeat protein
LNEAVIMDERNVLGHRLLGQVYYDSGRLYRAIETWERAKALDPENAELDGLLSKARRELEVEAPMRRDSGRNFIISYDGESHPDLGEAVLEVLEDAYRQIGYDLNYYPDTQIPVLLYTERDFSALTESPDWAGGLYDGKIRIPLGGVAAMTPKLRALLYHEYTHVAIHFMARGRCPVWINEGLAEVAERRIVNPPLDALRRALRKDALLPFGRLEKSFAGLPAEEVLLAYEQSYSLVQYILENFHYYRMTEILAAMGEGRSIGEAIAEGLGQFGISYDTLQSQWRRSVEESL